jgi:N-acyl homoserine lactone hydrolase
MKKMENSLPASAAARSTSVRRLYVLLCGFEILPKTISTRNRGGRFILSEPVCAYLLDTELGWVLLEAGMNPDNGRDSARMHEKFWRHGLTAPVIRDGHLMAKQLAEVGVSWADISHVILSHLHYDHCGQLRELTHARISVQRGEYEHAFSAAPGFAYFRDEYDDPRLQWDLHDGDWEAQPGLQLLETRGHTRGHQSAVVELPGNRVFVLPFDAGDLQENFDEEVLPGECWNDADALRAIRRLKAIEQHTGATRLLFHDPAAIQSMRLCPEYYG